MSRPAAGVAASGATRSASQAIPLVLLTLVYASGFADRNIINLLIDPIKAEFNTSDTILGLVTGFGFTTFQLLFAIPVARLADRTRRVPFVIGGLLLWSLATGTTGLAASLAFVVFARIGVGLGEACLQAPTHSILADVYGPKQRPVAFAVLSCGAELGIMAGLLIGGWVGQWYGWRMAFVVAGAPGVLLAVAAMLFLREPARGSADERRAGAALPLGVALRVLSRQRSYVLAVAAGAMVGLTVFTLQVWGPTFLRRAYHVESAAIGSWLGLIRGPAAIVGTLLGGLIGQRLVKRRSAWAAWVPAAACAIAAPGFYVFLFARSWPWAMAGFAAVTMMVGAQAAQMLALCQTVVPQRARALASALFIFPAQIVGLGIGSVLVGWLSDRLHPVYGDRTLAYALTIPATAALVAAGLLAIAGLQVGSDLARLRAAADADFMEGRAGASPGR